MTIHQQFDTTNLYASITHALPETVHITEYKHELIDFYSTLRTWIDDYKKQIIASSNENCMKTAQALQNNLSEFLTLPLRSDAEQMKKIIVEQLQEIVGVSSLENHFMSITGYKYYHPQTSMTKIKKLYNEYLTQTKRILSHKPTIHTVIETWISFTHLSTFYQLQQYISNELNEKYQRLFCSLGLPLITFYYGEQESPQKSIQHRFIIKLNIKPLVLNDSELESTRDELLYELSSFSWRRMKTNVLPSLYADELYIFEFQNREELHRFRNTIHNIIVRSKKPSATKLFSIAEFERLDDIEIL